MDQTMAQQGTLPTIGDDHQGTQALPEAAEQAAPSEPGETVEEANRQADAETAYPPGFEPRQFADAQLYRLNLPAFIGPFDLLLFLVHKHKIDLANIPVAVVTKHYLEYLEVMHELDVEIATEFLVMAAELLELKARLLIPRESEDEAEDEGIDPRADLARRLLEYERFKEAAESLGHTPTLGTDIFPSGVARLAASAPEGQAAVIFSNLDPFKLISALADLLRKADGPPVKVMQLQAINIRQTMEDILRRLSDGLTRAFIDLFVLRTSRLDIIVTFMSILELAKLRLIRIYQASNEEQVFVVPCFNTLGEALAMLYKTQEGQPVE